MATYDYVIVGAGSAGCILAHRLSADPQVTVLLLEAGGEGEDPRIHDPVKVLHLQRTSFDWAYATEPEPQLGGRSVFWPRGKVLGGCSVINAMVYVRGNRWDFDHWAELGNAGWGYEEVLPYFRRSENNHRGESRYHGVGGPLDVSDIVPPHPYSLSFIEAAVGLGHARNDDFNGERQFGTGLYQRNIVNRRRVSTATAFLEPSRGRANLRIETGAHAQRIVVERERAIGVDYALAGTPVSVRVRREVIVSCGAVDSPKLLMLSGIGPAGALGGLGIKVVRDAPAVGANLQDHPIMSVLHRRSTPPDFSDPGNDHKAGLFCNGTAASSEVAPELQFHFSPLNMGMALVNRTEAFLAALPNVSRPRSRGSIALRSPDPRDPPVIRANYYAEPADMKIAVDGVRIGRALMRSRAFAGLALEEVTPGPGYGDSRAELERAVRDHTQTVYHPVGTCRMGVDDAAVVDPQLRVRGIAGLRVVDASVMPTITTGNTAAATMMIAEKAADMIRAG